MHVFFTLCMHGCGVSRTSFRATVMATDMVTASIKATLVRTSFTVTVTVTVMVTVTVKVTFVRTSKLLSRSRRSPRIFTLMYCVQRSAHACLCEHRCLYSTGLFISVLCYTESIGHPCLCKHRCLHSNASCIMLC